MDCQKMSFLIPKYLSCIEYNFRHILLPKEVYDITTSLPPFSIDSHRMQQILPAPILRSLSIRNAWNPARSIWTLFPSALLVLTSQSNPGILFQTCFLLSFKQSSRSSVLGFFHLTNFLILWSSSSAIFFEDVRCLHGFFFIISCPWFRRIGFESAFRVNQFDEQNSQGGVGRVPAQKSHWL